MISHLYRVIRLGPFTDDVPAHRVEEVVDQDTHPLVAHATAHALARVTMRLHFVRVPSGELLSDHHYPCEVCAALTTTDDPLEQGTPCGTPAVAHCYDDLDGGVVALCVRHLQQLYPTVPVNEADYTTTHQEATP